MKKINFSDIKINDGFWKIKQDMLRETTLWAVYNRFRETKRFEAFSCTWKDGISDYYPHIFWDSDVAKWIEGAAYLLKEKRDEKIEAIIDEVVCQIEKNSDENGYFNSHYLVTEQDKRFTDRNCHELYCAGHLMEAAVAYYEATSKDTFLKAMCKYADYIERVFKIERSAAFTTPGHPEIELALVRLYEATGESRYLKLSKFFIDEHGKNEFLYKWGTDLYNQDEMPLRKRETAEGHCVRALYLFCAMADIAEKYGDAELLAASKRVFSDIVNKKMYITGGVGSTRIGEAFSIPYYLPNRRAYTETCAAIAMALFCERMQKIDVNSKYADTVERVLYNGFLSGISMDGKSFFYENPIEQDPKFNNINPSTNTKENFAITERVEIFKCSCCPPNIVRFIPSIGNLMYNYDEDTVYIQQYINSVAEFENIRISQKTEYPHNGKIKINFSVPQKRIALRIPFWCKKFSINADFKEENGYAYIDTKDISEIDVDFGMPITYVKSSKKVHENAGRVAIMRGPVVYCAEGVDNGEDLKCAVIDTSAALEIGEEEFILPNLYAKAYREKECEELYTEIGDDYEEFKMKLIPYYAFANRGETEMNVWLLKK